jgi:hypothetical protein
MATNSSNRSIVYPSGTTANRPTSVNNGYIYFNTTVGALQIYQNGSWYVLTNINAPGVPTSVVATDQGSGRAYNNGKASVAFSPATETFGFPATYTITPTPTTSPATFTGTSSPIIVTGLASSTQYTYTATATNNTGTSSASSASSGVTATTVPQAPTIGAVTGGAASASVAFTAGATGGASATYTVTSDPGNITATGSSSPITVTGLTDGTAYTFTVTATNSNGTSAASSASSSVTPQSWTPEGAYDALASVELTSSADFILFSGIPTGYKHLQLRIAMRSSRTEASDSLNLIFNGDTSSYPRHYIYGNGSTANVYTETSSAGNVGGYITETATAANATSNIFGHGIIDILDASSTNKYKTVRSLNGYDANGSGSIALNSHLWMSLNAINSIKIQSGGLGDWVSGSVAYLYGVK